MSVMITVSIDNMTDTRRITANLPDALLMKAMSVTGKGITETIVEGLERVSRSRALEKALALKGKISIQIDLEESRERRHR